MLALINTIFDYSFSSVYMLKAFYNPRLLPRGQGFSSAPRLSRCAGSFQLLICVPLAGLRIVPRSLGAGDLRLPPLISTEKTAPSDSAAFDKLRPRASRGELVAGHQSLPKSPALFRLRIGKKELKE